MKKRGKICYILFAVLEVLILAGSYILDYFTRKKMGMARYVSYKNHAWEEKYPIRNLTNTMVLLLLLLTVFVLFLFCIKRKKATKFMFVRISVMIVLTVIYAWFTITSSREIQRSYYFVSALYGLAAGIQIIRTGTGVIRIENKK